MHPSIVAQSLLQDNNIGYNESPDSGNILPNGYNVSSAYPNPFNPTTSLDYDVANDTHVSIAVYDISGQLVESLVDDYKYAGTYNIVWNAHNY